jgi:hypothetical protein
MAVEEKKGPRGRPRGPAGKKQMLVIMDEGLIKAVKMAALEDSVAMSHIVEGLVREWLAKRKGRKATR